MKVHLTVDASVAEQLTGVLPIGKLDPDGGVHVTLPAAVVRRCRRVSHDGGSLLRPALTV